MATVSSNSAVERLNKKNKQPVGPQSKGQVIMQVAELLKPSLEKRFQGVKNEDGLPVQPARIRGIALAVAQDMVNATLATKH